MSKARYNLLLLAIFTVLHICIFLIVFRSGLYHGWPEPDVSIPYLYASKMALGQFPYRDFAVEYPPVALAFMLIPRLFSPLAQPYILGFAIEIMLFDLLGMALITALWQKLGVSLWKTLTIYTLALLAIGPLIINRYDLIPAVIVLAAIHAFISGHGKIAYALLAVGLMTKIYPAVVVPLFLIYDLSRQRYRQAISGAVAFVLTASLIALPFLISSPGGFLESFTYQTGRGLQIESVLSSLLLLCQKLGLTTLTVEPAFGGTDVVSPLANALANITPVLVLLSLSAVFWLYYRRQRALLAEYGPADDSLNESQSTCLIGFSLLAVLAFILSNKVLSPQFIIWLYPLVPLVAGRWSRLPWMLFIIIGMLSYLIFPTGYRTLEEGDVRMIAVLLARNAALFGLAFAVARSDYGERRIAQTVKQPQD